MITYQSINEYFSVLENEVFNSDKNRFTDKNWDILYLKQHFLRYKQSVFFIKHILDKSPIKILELGRIDNKNFFVEILKELYPTSFIENIEDDLRYDFLKTEDNKFDLILCMETIEHIKDKDSTDMFSLSTFFGNGINNLLKNCNRLLNPNGTLFITTPNVNGYVNLINLIGYKHPYLYSPHPRELSFGELENYLKESNLKVDLVEFKNCWNLIPRQNIDYVYNFLLELGLEENREECIFLLSSKI